jgi:membrane-bound lytic murein transglycosylase B
MQFIPSTWAKWGADGNGDGIKNPDNIYDASLAAADYLCATSTNLETDAGLEAAYMSYNHSADYVTEVLAWAHAYAAADAAGLIPPMSAKPLYTLAPPTTVASGSTASTTTTAPGSAATGPSGTTTSTIAGHPGAGFASPSPPTTPAPNP